MADSLKIHEVDTSRFLFDPNHHTFYDKICRNIPIFNEYEVSHKKIAQQTLHRLYAWITLMYDMHTPLRREVKDLYKRKVYAGTLTKFTPNKLSGKYVEWVEKIFIGQDPEVNMLIVKFISSFSSPEYTQLMAHVSIQQNMLNKIINGTEKKEDQVMFDTATDKIKELTNLLYGTGERDEVYEARRALYKQVSYDLSDMRPEKVAKMAIEGGLPEEWGPYGDYSPGDIHFVGDDPSIADEDEK